MHTLRTRRQQGDVSEKHTGSVTVDSDLSRRHKRKGFQDGACQNMSSQQASINAPPTSHNFLSLPLTLSRSPWCSLFPSH